MALYLSFLYVPFVCRHSDGSGESNGGPEIFILLLVPLKGGMKAYPTNSQLLTPDP